MKVVLAPNAFKGCLTASEAARAMASGTLRAMPAADTVPVPVADGGVGLVDVSIEALGGIPCRRTVSFPSNMSRRIPRNESSTVTFKLSMGICCSSRPGRD